MFVGMINGVSIFVSPLLPHIYGVYHACNVSTRQEFDHVEKADMIHLKPDGFLTFRDTFMVSDEVFQMIKNDPKWQVDARKKNTVK